MPKKAKSKPKQKLTKRGMMNAKEQEDYMIQRYGTSCKWVDVSIHLTYQEMIDYFGPQCDEYEPLCANCTNWVSWQKTGKAIVAFEREELINHLKIGCKKLEKK